MYCNHVLQRHRNHSAASEETVQDFSVAGVSDGTTQIPELHDFALHCVRIHLVWPANTKSCQHAPRPPLTPLHYLGFPRLLPGNLRNPDTGDADTMNCLEKP